MYKSKREKEYNRHHHLVRLTMQRVENLIKNDFKTNSANKMLPIFSSFSFSIDSGLQI